MSVLFELLNEIDRYLIGLSSDRYLESWVVSNLQRILDSGDTMAIRLANEVDVSFIETGEDIIDRATLNSRLDALVRKARTFQFEFAEAGVAAPSGRKGDGKKRFAKIVEALRSGGVSLIFEKKVVQDREKEAK